MGCSSSKLDHLEDSLHVMLSNETRTKLGTAKLKKDREYMPRQTSDTGLDTVEDNEWGSHHFDDHIGSGNGSTVTGQ